MHKQRAREKTAIYKKRFDNVRTNSKAGKFETRKRLDKPLLISAALISALLFFTGIAVGITINEQKTSFLRERITDLNSELESFQLEFLLLDTFGENASCPLLKARVGEVNQESYELGQKLVSYEETSKFRDDTELTDIKKAYYRSLIRYWLLNRKVEEACGERTLNVIFFFVARCPACDDQATVLDYYKSVLRDDILIFTLNADVKDPFIETLRKFYSIESYPSLVVDGIKRENFRSKEDLKREFCGSHPSLNVCAS